MNVSQEADVMQVKKHEKTNRRQERERNLFLREKSCKTLKSNCSFLLVSLSQSQVYTQEYRKYI